MTVIPPEVLTALQERRGIFAHALYWFAARNLTSGEVETLGVWSGDQSQVFVIGGESRTYHGAVAIEAGTIRSGLGFNVPGVDLVFADLAPEVQALLRGYDVRGAPCEIHVVLFRLDTGAQIAAPIPRFLGRVDTLSFSTGGMDNAGRATSTAPLGLLPAHDQLTVALPAFRSDADQQAAYPGDPFFRHVATAATAEVVVGGHKVRGGQAGPVFGDLVIAPNTPDWPPRS